MFSRQVLKKNKKKLACAPCKTVLQKQTETYIICKTHSGASQVRCTYVNVRRYRHSRLFFLSFSQSSHFLLRFPCWVEIDSRAKDRRVRGWGAKEALNK